MLSLTPPPPIFLFLTLPSVSVSSGMRCCLRPRIPLSPYAPCGAVFFLIWTVTLTMRVDDLMMGPPFLLSQSLSFPLSVSLLQWQRGQWCRLFTVSLTCPPPHCTYPVGHIMKDYFNLIIAHFRLITESRKLSTLSSFFIRLNSLHSESFGVS